MIENLGGKAGQSGIVIVMVLLVLAEVFGFVTDMTSTRPHDVYGEVRSVQTDLAEIRRVLDRQTMILEQQTRLLETIGD